jgi:integrin-linked kinase-associated serine/threonine phosphatase 2C
LKSGTISELGRRATNEDTHIAVDDVKEGYSGKERVAFYGVYDGHGGMATAQGAVKHVHQAILTDPEFAAGDIEQAIINGYQRADKLMEVAGDKSGSTAVTALIYGKVLFLANIGDSEAVLATREGKGPVQQTLLTHKHVPTDRAEKERVTSLGAMVVFGRLFGTLAVSRAFGDREFKDPARMFVSCEPHVVVRPLVRNDSFLVVACDGLWDKVSYQEAVDFVAAHRDSGETPERVAEALAKLSLDRGSLDNVTVVVVYFIWG